MRLLLTIFLFPITFYGQVAIGTSTTVDPDVILDLTNTENRGLLLNKTSVGPTAPIGNIFYNNSKNMIGVVGNAGNYYLSPWKHTDANSDVTFTSAIGKVIIKNSIATPAVPPRVILEVENGSINVENGKVKEGGHDLVPAGCIMMWCGTSPPDGWLECDGVAKTRTGIYKALFDVIGSTYGPGDGSTTFDLPNFNDRFPKGSSATNPSGMKGGQKNINISVGNLPPIPHTHDIGHNHTINHEHKNLVVSDSGEHTHDMKIPKRQGIANSKFTVFYADNDPQTKTSFTTTTAGKHNHNVTIPALSGSSGPFSGSSGTASSSGFNSQAIGNEPPFLTIKYIIKY